MKKLPVLGKQSESNGFSLIEVLIFTTILSLFFVTAAAVAVFNLRNTTVQEHKILATRYAEEAIEWLRSEKEDDWSTFTLHDAGAGGTTYCLNSLDWSSQSACDVYSLGTPSIFKRDLLIKNSGVGAPVDNVNVTVTVSWQDNNSTFNVPINSVFKLLE